ncbi:MAG: cadherin-like beta sandwich domain-containing protein [Clostridia bacterium]|nr:cadherin-like beta sandwich domain-containing protein [Clostridia bacterium]
MKRILALTVIAVLLLPLVSIGAFAAASIDVSGASKAYPGDTVTLTVKINASEITGANAARFDMVFDSEQISYKSCDSLRSEWDVAKSTHSGAVKLLFSCNKNGGDTLGGETFVKVKFTLSDSLAKGENVSVSFKNIEVSSTDGDEYPSDYTYSVTITQKSSDATLYSLSIGDVTLSPAFSSDVTSYTAAVDYRTTPLKVNYKTNDPNAKAKVAGATLKEGKNTLTITVTAEDGTTKKYTVAITMKENPNPLSSDSKISSLSLSTGTISPEFDPDVYEYTVYIDSAVTSITFSPVANDKKATVSKKVVGITDDETEVILTCTAEDGSKKNYKFTVIRENDGEGTTDTTESSIVTDAETTAPDENTNDVVTDDITASPESDTAKETEKPAEDTEGEDTEKTVPPDGEQIGMNKPVPLWSLLLFSIISLILGALISAFIFKRNF